jgi:uncharacterized surface protein with fasciclin (FAS1) repeats
MKQIKYSIMISVVLGLFALSGCEIAGLDFQKNFEFDASIRDSKIDMTAMEFMESRADLFSSMIEAVKYAGLTEEYTKPGRTFLFLTNRALSDETYAPTGNSVMGSYFACNKIPNPNYDPADATKGPQFLTPDSWDVYPVQQVKDFLLYHIVKEEVTYRNAKAFPVFYESLSYQNQGDTTKVSIYLINDRNAQLRINGFIGSRKTDLAPRTGGIDCTNGVIHVLDDFIIPPTKSALGLK